MGQRKLGTGKATNHACINTLILLNSDFELGKQAPKEKDMNCYGIAIPISPGSKVHLVVSATYNFMLIMFFP